MLLAVETQSLAKAEHEAENSSHEESAWKVADHLWWKRVRMSVVAAVGKLSDTGSGPIGLGGGSSVAVRRGEGGWAPVSMRGGRFAVVVLSRVGGL